MPTDRIPFQGQSVLELRHGDDRALISPEAGGRLLLWESAGRRIIHWPETADWSNPAKIRGGNPLLFPFLGRHFVDGTIHQWRDATGKVRDMPMHGFARNAAFTLRESPNPATATLELGSTRETRESYPFDFSFRVIYTLGASELAVRFETENRDSSPLPYYAGHHFYFALPENERAQWSLSLPPSRQAGQREDGSIEMKGTSTRAFLLNNPALQDTFHILQEPGHPLIRHPDGRTLEFVLDSKGAPWHTVTTWTEKPDSPFYCVEPWLGLPNAIHHGEGLRHVAPGTTEKATCTLRAVGW
jgi:galactose mutarotase-like enzyme